MGAAKVPGELCTNSDTLNSAETKAGRPAPFISAIAICEAPGEFKTSAGLKVPGVLLLLKNTPKAPSSKPAVTTSITPSPLRSAPAMNKGLNPSAGETRGPKNPPSDQRKPLNC